MLQNIENYRVKESRIKTKSKREKKIFKNYLSDLRLMSRLYRDQKFKCKTLSNLKELVI